MEWYYVLAIIAGSLLTVGFLIYLGMKGVLGKSGMSIISQISTGLSALISTIAAATENTAIDIMAFVMQLVKSAVSAAENAYYNDEITADQRFDLCQKYIDKMLEAAQISLTIEQWNIIDALIRAACEEMGHGMVAAKTAELITEKEAALSDKE
jgi:hypothetical protein